MTGPKPKTVPSKGVSLSGKTRLTYREACALLAVAVSGDAEMDAMGGDAGYNSAEHNAAQRAIDKLKTAISKIGGYDGNGNLLDPFAK